ncbi:MAG: nucleotidyltransferase family protein [Rubrivivax sp.]|nr:nucleotidyltransferase family protein [Rubrivivax sp.]MBK7260772.1 nucleotidyltransferase family protein [Rubrivivax sp.]MBK8526448.1 nucleotidyltransferase family protein [Rubrivivax sp.]
MIESIGTDLHWLQALRDPEIVTGWSLPDWQDRIRLARRLRLLGRLAERVHSAELQGRLPEPVQRHLLAERRQSQARGRAMWWTLAHVGQALADTEYPKVLLKGAAYMAQRLPNSQGRLPSDLDILVPRAMLADAQQRLGEHEWKTVELDAHDQRYYNEWSHEIPPMRHALFSLELDVHHGILPPVASTTVDADLLLARIIPSGQPGWSVFAPVDQWIHCAVHLMLDSELRDRIRDLVDLDELGRHFGRSPSFWTELVDRSNALGLLEPVALAVHYTTKWLQTPIPADVHREFRRQGPGPIRRRWLLPLLDAVLTPTLPDARDSWQQGLAATALLTRYHWGRMPIHLLLPHLWHKARARRKRGSESDERV